MTALGTTANSAKDITPNSGVKMLMVNVLQSALATTTGVNPADTFTVDLSPTGGYGGTGQFWGIRGQVHTVLNSSIIDEAPSTSISSAGVLTVTIGGGVAGGYATLASSKTRTYTILYS